MTHGPGAVVSDSSAVIAAARARVEAALGHAAAVLARPPCRRDAAGIAGRIDHTLLKAGATRTEIGQLCDEALAHGFASVCVNSRWVPFAARALAGSTVLVCTVAGFPLGAMAPRAKAAEARIAVEEGAQEVDMVIDVGGLLSGDLVAVHRDMVGVAEAAAGRPVKVILETCLLNDEQKAIACLIALRTPVAFVKTSTGFGSGGATVGDVALMRACVGAELGVKASGGIRTRADAEAMIAAGADRLGASASVAIAGGAAATGSGY